MAESDAMTLVYTDLVNSTGHLGSEIDENEEKLFHIHHKLLTEAVNAHGGRELQWMGNGILAGFASTSDAVKCAIAIQQAVRRPTEGLRLEIRIGVHFGEIRQRPSGYFGAALDVARQLCNQATSGQILCTTTVEELLGARQHFNFKELGHPELQGSSAGVCEVVYESSDPVAMLSRTPFVGRSVQQKRLAAKLEEACNGRGSVAMLRGEPGVGKTRLLEEFGDAAVHRGAIVLRGACYDGEWQQPFGPFAEAIVEYARHAAPAELSAALGKRAPVLARIAPALHDLIGDIAEPPSLEGDAETFRLFDAVAQFLIAISRTAPLALVLDDLHWADRGVIGMLKHVAHFAPSNSILVIGAYRDAEVTRKHPLTTALAAISRLRNFESLSLHGLTDGEVAQLLELIGDHDAPAELVKALTEATEGNPLFIRELLMHLVEEGKILSEGGDWISRFSVEELGIPEGVRQIIDRRLAKLSDEAKRLLSAAAAFKGSFPFNLASAVADLDEHTALAAIDDAMEAQLVRPGVDPDSFDFTHALIRQTLYTEMNSVRRARLHRKIAEEMERAWGELASEHAAEVAFHFWRGATSTGTDRGADYAIAAADHAAAAYAHDDVGAFLRIALELLGPKDSRRPRLLGRMSFALTWSLNADEALRTALEAGALIVASEGPAAGAEYYEQIARAMYNAGLTLASWELAREGRRYIGERRDIVWASLAELDIIRSEAEDPNNPGIAVDSEASRELLKVLWQLPASQLQERNMERVHSSRREILEDTAPVPRIFMRSGDYRKSLAMWQQDAANSEQRGAIARATRAWAGIGRCHNALGNFVEGRAALDRAAALAARMGLLSFGMITLLGVYAEFHFAIDDDWPEFVDRTRDILGLRDSPMFTTMAQENKWALACTAGYASYMYALVGQRELAIKHLDFVIPAVEAGALWSINYILTVGPAAGTAWLLDHREHAEVIERNLREKVVGPDLHHVFWDGHLSVARMCALQGRHDEAIKWFAEARTVLDANGARPLRAITDYDEALMYLRRRAPGDVERAQPLLEAATRQFMALDMSGWVRRAEAALKMD